MPDTSTPDNPATTQGVDNTGDAATQLVQQYQASAGESQGSTPSAPTQPDGDTGSPVAAEQGPDISAGKITRLEQRLAGQGALLKSLGIDPDSDVADRLKAGLVTPDEILQQVKPSAPPAAPQTASDKFASYRGELEKRVQSPDGELTQQDFLNLVNLTDGVMRENQQYQQQSQLSALQQSCQGAVQTVLDADLEHSKLPDDIKEIETQLFWTSTDNRLGVDANTYGNPASYFTPRSYAHYAQKNLESFRKLRAHWTGQTRTAAQPVVTQVNPISSQTGSGPLSPPEPEINSDNVDEAVRAWAENQGQV